MSFPITEPQAIMMLVAIGTGVYIWTMIRSSRTPKPPKNEANFPPLPPPPTAEQTANNNSKIKTLFHTPFKHELTPIETKLKEQEEQLARAKQQIGELKFAVALKPDPPKPVASLAAHRESPSHISSNQKPRRNRSEEKEDAEWRKEQPKGEDESRNRSEEKEDDNWTEEQKDK